MLEKTRAIVLRTVRHTDSQLIADLYTEVRGRVAVLVRVASGRKGRGLRAMLAPWTALDCELDYRPGRQLQRLAEVRPLMPWASLEGSAVRAAVALFLSEVTAVAVRGEAAEPELFAFLLDSVEALGGPGGLDPNFHIAFLLMLTRHLGFMPSPRDWREGLMFDLRTGEFTALAPPHPDVLGAADTRLMHQALRMTYRTSPLFRLGREGRGRVLDVVMRYYSLHVAAFRPPRSLPVVREVFA